MSRRARNVERRRRVSELTEVVGLPRPGVAAAGTLKAAGYPYRDAATAQAMVDALRDGGALGPDGPHSLGRDPLMATTSTLSPLDGTLDDGHSAWLVGHYKSENIHLTFRVRELERQLRRSRVLLWIALAVMTAMGLAIGGLVYYGDGTRLAGAIRQFLPAHVAGQ